MNQVWAPRYGFLILLAIGILLWCAIPLSKNADRYRAAVFVFNELRQAFRTTFTENDMEFSYDYSSLMSQPPNNEKRRMPALPYISGETLLGFADHFMDNTIGANLKPEAVESGHIIFVKTDFVDIFFRKHHPKIRKPYVLLTHNSDFPAGANQTLKYLNDIKLLAWYGQNVVNKHHKLFPIPLGVANAKWPHGNVAILKAVSRQLKPFNKRKTLLYINFNTQTNPNRVITLAYFRNMYGNDSSTYFAQTMTGWEEYMLQLGDTQFVISPPGHGIDCHRTWEALIMGAVPIVQRSGLQALYDDMPVMVVNDWKEVTRENLSQFQQGLRLSPDGVPRRPKIWARYWLDQLQAIRLNHKSLKVT